MAHPIHRPLGGKVVTKPFIFFGLLAVVGAYFILRRFLFGLDDVTNLSGGYPWGIWVVVDIMVATAFGCGGFAMALLVYIFNRNKFHPLVRPALLGGLFGYTLAAVALMVDLGRYWNAFNILLPWQMNLNSIMFEVAICMMAYILVLWIEFSPAFLDRLGLRRLREWLQRYMFIIIALGVVLPTMHQSSFGSVLLVMGSQLSPLWYTTWLPLLFLLTALAMGYSVVILESTLVSNAFALPSEQRLLSKLSPVLAALLAGFLVLRFADILWRGQAGLMFAGDVNSLMFWIENLLFLAAAVILGSPTWRRNQRLMFLAALLMVAGGTIYRLDAFLIAYEPGNGWTYFPSVSEIMVTVAVVSVEIMLYLWFVKRLPVLHIPREASQPSTA
ncbi:MAG: Ni/Fe-hydrogenase cytochrome b subunit [Chromatiaceae bacterium]|nr:Ni/Fe-hydrogenase cytochrome b subunit [Chromatiaceae bacterium]